MEEDFDEAAAAAAAPAADAATTAGLRACSELLQQCEEYAPLLKEQEFKDHEASPFTGRLRRSGSSQLEKNKLNA